MKISHMLFAWACLFALCWLAFGIRPVSAAELFQTTNTPTATWEPLIKTATPQPPRDYSCPEGLPIGWGMVTPGALWSSGCGPCMQTLTPRPTSTPFWPSATPDPLVSATPTLAAGSNPWVFEFVPNLDSLTFPVTGSPATGAANTPLFGDSGWVVGLVISASESNGFNNERYALFDSAGSYGFGASNAGTALVFVSNDRISPEVFEAVFGDLQTYFDYQVDFRDNTSGLQSAVIKPGEAIFDLADWEAGLPAQYPFDLWTYRVNSFVTRTITLLGYITIPGDALVVSTPATYCAEVNGLGGSAEPFDFGLDLPQILIGPAACYGISGFSVPTGILALLGIEVENFEVPTIQICFRPISFQPLSLFGISIDIDYMIFIVAAVLGIRWVLRS